MVAYDEHGGGASLLGYELARMIFCDAEPLAGGGPSPLSLLGKGLRGPRSVAGDKVRDVIEHDRPAATPTAPSAPAKPSPGTAATIYHRPWAPWRPRSRHFRSSRPLHGRRDLEAEEVCTLISNLPIYNCLYVMTFKEKVKLPTAGKTQSAVSLSSPPLIGCL